MHGAGSTGRLNSFCAFSSLLPENLDPAVELACHAGFKPADIANKLREVLDSFRQKQLRSESRNLAARKVVLDRRYERERLLCESDDLMIIYDCKLQLVLDWFIRKDKRRRLTHFEEDAQNCAMVWSPVCNEKYKPTCDMLSRKVAVLASAIRHFFGLFIVLSTWVLSVRAFRLVFLFGSKAKTWWWSSRGISACRCCVLNCASVQISLCVCSLTRPGKNICILYIQFQSTSSQNEP